MADSTPGVARTTPLFSTVEGVFYRAVDPAHERDALAGSRGTGRYSSGHQPTLYLSSSPEGVEAAMVAHRDEHSTPPVIVQVAVVAERVFDLRSDEALTAAGIDLADAMASWQEEIQRGATPRPWAVRERLQALGCLGLIDPSRKAPGLWHLVLFAWGTQPPVSVSLRPA